MFHRVYPRASRHFREEGLLGGSPPGLFETQVNIRNLAERVGFEPTWGAMPPTDFESPRPVHSPIKIIALRRLPGHAYSHEQPETALSGRIQLRRGYAAHNPPHRRQRARIKPPRLGPAQCRRARLRAQPPTTRALPRVPLEPLPRCCRVTADRHQVPVIGIKPDPLEPHAAVFTAPAPRWPPAGRCMARPQRRSRQCQEPHQRLPCLAT